MESEEVSAWLVVVWELPVAAGPAAQVSLGEPGGQVDRLVVGPAVAAAAGVSVAAAAGVSVAAAAAPEPDSTDEEEATSISA